MDVLESKSIDRNEVLERLARMKRELAKKEKKLEKFKRAQRAKAHVKQKLREQAFLENSGQSPSFTDTESTPQSSTNETQRRNTDFIPRNCGLQGIIARSDSRETTPTGPTCQTSRMPFLTRLGQTLPAKLEANHRDKHNHHDNKHNVVLGEVSNKSCDRDCVELISSDQNSEVLNQSKITISPDLLEDFPFNTRSKSKKDFKILDDSLCLTPNVQSAVRNDAEIDTVPDDFNDVKLKLLFETDKHPGKLKPGSSQSDLAAKTLLKVKENSQTKNSSTSQKRQSHSQEKETNSSQHDFVSKKRKSCDTSEVRKNFKRLKANSVKSNEGGIEISEAVSTGPCSKQSKESMGSSKSSHLPVPKKSSQNFESKESSQEVKQKKSCKKHNSQKSEKCVVKPSADMNYISCADEENDSVTIVADSMSPDPSQSILKPKKGGENTVVKVEKSEETFEQKNSVIEISQSEYHELNSSGQKDSQSQKKNVKKAENRFTELSESENKLNISSMSTDASGGGFLDFTELDVIPFSQFQYSDCLFSSGDLISGAIQGGKKGRRSHFGMLVQRRSPRLSTGLKNIVGDDYVEENTNTEESHSQKLSQSLTVSSQSSYSEPFSDGKKLVVDRCKRPKSARKSKKGIMISSVFQFIIDEAKRVKEYTNFDLPNYIVNLNKCDRLLPNLTSENTPKEVSLKTCCDMNMPKLQNQIVELSVDGVGEDDTNRESNVINERLLPKFDQEDVFSREKENCKNMSLLTEMNILDSVRDGSRSITSTPKTNSSEKRNHRPLFSGNRQRESKDVPTPKAIFDTFTTPKAKSKSLPPLKTPKDDCVSQTITSTPKSEKSTNSLQFPGVSKHKPSHMSTPKPNNDPFTTPKQQIRRHKYDFNTELTMSPTLFPSQDCRDFASPVTMVTCSPVSASKASPLGVADLPEESSCPDEEHEEKTASVTKTDTEGEKQIVTVTEKDEEASEITLKTVATFQTCKREPILSVHCGVLHTAGSLVDFVVTLSASTLGIWSVEGAEWNNELDWIQPGDSEAKRCWLMPCEDKVVVLVSSSSDEAPVSVSVFVYDWLSGDSNRFTLPLNVSNNSVECDTLCCPLTERQVAVFYQQGMKTGGQKLTLGPTFTVAIDDVRLERVTGQLISVCPVQDVCQAVIGLTKDSVVHLWNHKSGMVLKSINIGNCCPFADSLISAYSEQGFLLLTLTVSEAKSPACFIAVNPMASTSVKLQSFDGTGLWKGCRSSVVHEDLLLSVDQGGSLYLWEMTSGLLIGQMEGQCSVSLAVDPSKEQIYSGQESGCVHVLQFS